MPSDGRNHWDDGPPIELRGDPAYRQRSTAYAHDHYPDEEPEPERRRRRIGPLRVALAGLVLLGFGALVVYAYTWGTSDPDPEELPLVTAPGTPEKERPESPGGMEVPYQDSLVLNPGERSEEGVERLLPPPEEPRPPEPESETATQATEAGQAGPAIDGTGEEADVSAEEAPEGEETATAPAQVADEPLSLDSMVSEIAEAPAEEETSPEASVTEDAADETEEPAVTVEQEEPAAEQAAAPASGGFVIQLASVGNRDAIEREWSRMQERHPEVLGDLTLQVEEADLGERGTFYRLQAGPVPTRESADQLCARLQAAQQDCLVRAR
ncbi:SPOR domain-containing protein [Aquibaculum sediminis]|uniref:SPOR domain-containing protein n=1 Tax=Aquibaculum sediminis TaxID=3231907 RepID=UPI0034518AFA